MAPSIHVGESFNSESVDDSLALTKLFDNLFNARKRHSNDEPLLPTKRKRRDYFGSAILATYQPAGTSSSPRNSLGPGSPTGCDGEWRSRGISESLSSSTSPNA